MRFLEIKNNLLDINDVTKLEKWYLNNISKQPPCDKLSTVDEKLSILKHDVNLYLRSVASIEPAKIYVAYSHLKGMNAVQYASRQGYDIYLETSLAENKSLNDINKSTKVGLSPLHLAALFGHLITSRLLLNKGADSRLTSKLNQTPAHLSLTNLAPQSKGNLKDRKKAIFKLLIDDRNQNILATDSSGNTMVHIATSNGYTSAVKNIIEKKPELAVVKNNSGHSPLHTALLNNKSEIIDILLKLDALLLMADHNNRLPIHYAALHSNSSVLEVLIHAHKQQHLDLVDLNLRSPLILAAQQGDLAKVKLLIDRGADLSLQDQYGQDFLHHAVMSLNFELVQWVLDNTNADINLQDNNGRTPLINILSEEELEQGDTAKLVDYLKSRSDLNLKDKYGQSLSSYFSEEPAGLNIK